MIKFWVCNHDWTETWTEEWDDPKEGQQQAERLRAQGYGIMPLA